jgi:uncharacterized coiled-coil protein SlyX
MSADPVTELAAALDRQADLMLRLSEAVGKLDRSAEILELREEMRALSNRIEAVQRYGVETRKALGREMIEDA